MQTRVTGTSLRCALRKVIMLNKRTASGCKPKPIVAQEVRSHIVLPTLNQNSMTRGYFSLSSPTVIAMLQLSIMLIAIRALKELQDFISGSDKW